MLVFIIPVQSKCFPFAQDCDMPILTGITRLVILVLRTLALWERNKKVLVLLMAVLLVSVSKSLYVRSLIRSNDPLLE